MTSWHGVKASVSCVLGRIPSVSLGLHQVGIQNALACLVLGAHLRLFKPARHQPSK
jgi:hypothetical protein